jgi:hypothetical protein
LQAIRCQSAGGWKPNIPQPQHANFFKIHPVLQN